jgi:hypothetical protein
MPHCRCALRSPQLEPQIVEGKTQHGLAHRDAETSAADPVLAPSAGGRCRNGAEARKRGQPRVGMSSTASMLMLNVTGRSGCGADDPGIRELADIPMPNF